MASSHDALSVSLREAQLETSDCWCHSPSFFPELDDDGEEYVPLGTASQESGGDKYLWFSVVFRGVLLRRGAHVVGDFGLYLPPAVWYYGTREEHYGGVGYGSAAETMHSCVVALVAAHEPCRLSEIAVAFSKVAGPNVLGLGNTVVLGHCPGDCGDERSAYFSRVACWAQRRIAFVDAARKERSKSALWRAVFGYAGILDVLRYQFGAWSDPLAVEMALARSICDEEVEEGIARMATRQSEAALVRREPGVVDLTLSDGDADDEWSF